MESKYEFPEDVPVEEAVPVKYEEPVAMKKLAVEPVKVEEPVVVEEPAEKPDIKDIEDDGGTPITRAIIEKVCLENDDLYETPELNGQFFLHYYGFTKICNLEPYTELITLWLQNNSLTKIEGLSTLKKLKSLYLNDNHIRKIENLDNLPSLVTLNLSGNFINTIENLSGLPKLSTLQMKKNNVSRGFDHLAQCKALKSIDLSENNLSLEDPASLLQPIPELAYVVLKKNPCSRKGAYRKKMIATLPILNFLDDRKVSPVERVGAVAFMKGGIEAERQARKDYFAEEDRKQHERDRKQRELRRKRIQEKKDREAKGIKEDTTPVARMGSYPDPVFVKLQEEKLKREEKERAEQEKQARIKAEQEKAEQERAEQERAEQERAEQEKAEQEKAEQEKAETPENEHLNSSSTHSSLSTEEATPRATTTSNTSTPCDSKADDPASALLARVVKASVGQPPEALYGLTRQLHFWGAQVDRGLVEQCRAHLFDFGRVVEALVRTFPNKPLIQLLNADLCRLRYSDLYDDAEVDPSHFMWE